MAEQRRGFCAPNPVVAAVVVKEGEVISVGVHQQAGQPHAEVNALEPLAHKAEGATLYVTLEPCSHWGQTPPCTKLIIKSGIKTVYYAMLDPNPKVAGDGVGQLKKAGIECYRLKVKEITDFYDSYVYWLENQRPRVTAKLAITLDGKIAGKDGQPMVITGDSLKRYTHQWRRHSDAILTTSHTIMNDDPQFNVRIDDEILDKPIYILDSSLRVSPRAKLFHNAENITLFHRKNSNGGDKDRLIARGVRCIPVSGNDKGLDLDEVLEIIGADGIHDLWLEAGSRCFQSFLQQQLLRRALIYIAPKVVAADAMSAFTKAVPLEEKAQKIQWHQCGDDAVLDLLY